MVNGQRSFDVWKTIITGEPNAQRIDCSVKYDAGNGTVMGSCGGGDPESDLVATLVNIVGTGLLHNPEYRPSGNRLPIVARLHVGENTFSAPLETLLRLYACAERVPITVEYLPEVYR